jgi:hypothetical protein
VKKTPKSQGEPRFSRNGIITARGIERLCSAIEDDNAHPDDVRAAVRRVYESQTGILAGAPLDQFELAFVCLAFARYLDGKFSFDQAFGVTKSRTGRPSVPIKERMSIARAVWERYLPTKDSLESVETMVGDDLGRGQTQVHKYFREYFLASYLSFRRHRQRAATPHENRRFQKLNKLHQERERRLPPSHAHEAFNVTRSDGTISVDGPWSRLRSRPTKPTPRR